MTDESAKTRKKMGRPPSAQKRLEGDLRTKRLMEIIATGQYLPHVTDEQLAAEWGIPATTVRCIAANAARCLRLAGEANDLLMQTMAGALDTIRVIAMNGDPKTKTKPDLKAAIEAIKTRLALGPMMKEAERAASGHADSNAAPVFRVELSYPERPKECPPSGSSSPVTAGQGTGSPGSSPGS